MSCDPNKQPSGHGRRYDEDDVAAVVGSLNSCVNCDPVSKLILDLDSSRCVNCKGGEIVALETGDKQVTATCRNCGTTQEFDLANI